MGGRIIRKERRELHEQRSSIFNFIFIFWRQCVSVMESDRTKRLDRKRRNESRYFSGVLHNNKEEKKKRQTEFVCLESSAAIHVLLLCFTKDM